jgi:hypothetical protein
VEATTTPPDQKVPETPEVEGKEGKEKEQAVPYDRFKEVNERAKQLDEELADMRTKLVEFEDRDKSDVERERAARERAEAQLNDLMGKVTSLEKGAWVRSAAAELNFHDPEDAVAHLHDRLGKLEDQREAKKLVERLAKSKEHLVRSEKPKPKPPAIGQVFAGQDTEKSGQPALSPQQRAAEQEQRFAEGLRQELSKFLPQNSESGWYEADGA